MRTRDPSRTGSARFALSRLCCIVWVVSCFLVLPAWGGNDIYGSPDDPLAATVLGTAVHTRDPQEMQFVVTGKLLDRYAAGEGIAVTSGEVAEYLAAQERFMAGDRQRREARRAELAAMLKAETVLGEQREALSRELEVLEQLAASEKDEATEADDPEIKAYTEEVARSFILRWKVNRALYRQYGGRIIFQQAGPEPLDAYRRFLDEQAAKGNFKILDSSMEKEFWRYYVTDASHDFYPPGSEAEAHAFGRMSPADDTRP